MASPVTPETRVVSLFGQERTVADVAAQVGLGDDLALACELCEEALDRGELTLDATGRLQARSDA